ncbi:MAG TPA: SRPBCC domain-containing protein [Parafilimonas sp.]|nr:SRPBCC domain-containing protein [Parafilimonas sp.]
MNNEPFVIERTYNAPVEKVWKALTDNEQMKQWYFNIAAFKPEVGFEFTFDGGSKEKTYTHLCKILEVIPNKKLSYSWRYKDYEGYSVVTFELFDEGEKTRLKLTHTGLETFPQVSKDFTKESFTQGWTHIIGISLKNFVENN